MTVAYLLFALTGIFLIAGIIFIVRGLRNGGVSEDPDVAVPISDFNEVKTLDRIEKIQTSRSSQTSQFIQETFKSSEKEPIDLTEKTKSTTEPQQPQQEKKEDLPEPSVEETLPSDIFPSEQSDLQWQLRKEKERVESLENELQALKQIFQGKEGSEVTDLGAELERLKSEKDKWGEEELKGAAQIGALREEISRLQEEYQGEQSSLKEKLEKTEVSRQNLEEELKRAQGKLAGIEQKAKEIERTNSDKLRDAYTQISDLKAQLEGQKPRETEHIRQQLTGARAAVDELKKERERVLQLKNKAEEQVAKIKEHNTYLLEKDKALQYELTKSRAQRIGLEKMCEDFKMQMERASASPKV